MNEIFTKRIKNLRTSNGMTQDDISKVLNVRRSTYGEYERGKINPPSDKLNALAEYFGVTVDYLLGNDERLIDLSKSMTLILEQLNSSDVPVKFEGVKLDETTIDLMRSSLENTMKIVKTMNRTRT